MALVKGTNSYATTGEAELYFEDRLIATAFSDADSDLQDRSMVSAWHILEQMPWKGDVAEDDQPMAFPRRGSYYDPSRGIVVDFERDVVDTPDRVKIAQYEMALHLLVNTGLLNESGKVTALTAGDIQLDQIQSVSRTPRSVRRQISYLLRGGFSGGLRRSN